MKQEKIKFKRVIKNNYNWRDSEHNTKMYVEEVEKLRDEVFDMEYTKVKVQSFIVNAYYDKEKSIIDEKDYQKILKDGLEYFSDHTGCVDDLKVTQKLLDKLFAMKIIDSEMYRECIEQSACGRWM